MNGRRRELHDLGCESSTTIGVADGMTRHVWESKGWKG